MLKPKLVYEIEDAFSVEDNLNTLGGAIDALDPRLSTILNAKLAAWASGDPVDLDAIWDALYAATALQLPAQAGDPA